MLLPSQRHDAAALFALRQADLPALHGGYASRLSLPRLRPWTCLLYTSDAADERSSVDLGGRRIIKKKNMIYSLRRVHLQNSQYLTLKNNSEKKKQYI